MGGNFELKDGFLCGCTLCPVHHYHLYYFFSVFKIIWNVDCLLSGGWKEVLIPLPCGNVQIDRWLGW